MNVGKPLPPHLQARLRGLIRQFGLAGTAKLLGTSIYLLAKAAAGAGLSRASTAEIETGMREAA